MSAELEFEFSLIISYELSIAIFSFGSYVLLNQLLYLELKNQRNHFRFFCEIQFLTSRYLFYESHDL